MRDGRLRQLASLPSPQPPRLVETNQRPPSQLFRLAVGGLQSLTMALYEPSHATSPKKRRVSAWISARSGTLPGSQHRQRWRVRLWRVERAFHVRDRFGPTPSTVDNSAAASAKRAGGGGVLSTTSKELAPAAMSAKDEWTAKVNAKGDEVRKAKAAKADK